MCGRQVVFDGADEEHVCAVGRRDLPVLGVLVCVMEIPGAQHAAVDHHVIR